MKPHKVDSALYSPDGGREMSSSLTAKITFGFGGKTWPPTADEWQCHLRTDGNTGDKHRAQRSKSSIGEPLPFTFKQRPAGVKDLFDHSTDLFDHSTDQGRGHYIISFT